jgi:hypothetical protein
MIAVLIAGDLVGDPEPRPTADGRTIAVATVKARVGKNLVEHWQIQAHKREIQLALMRLKAGDFVAIQGVPNARTVTVGGKPVIQHILFAETVTPLKPEGGDDVPL